MAERGNVCRKAAVKALAARSPCDIVVIVVNGARRSVFFFDVIAEISRVAATDLSLSRVITIMAASYFAIYRVAVCVIAPAIGAPNIANQPSSSIIKSAALKCNREIIIDKESHSVPTTAPSRM